MVVTIMELACYSFHRIFLSMQKNFQQKKKKKDSIGNWIDDVPSLSFALGYLIVKVWCWRLCCAILYFVSSLVRIAILNFHFSAQEYTLACCMIMIVFFILDNCNSAFS